MNHNTVDKLTAKSAKAFLKKLIEKLDELDEEDFFGPEGWRHFFNVEHE